MAFPPLPAGFTTKGEVEEIPVEIDEGGFPPLPEGFSAEPPAAPASDFPPLPTGFSRTPPKAVSSAPVAAPAVRGVSSRTPLPGSPISPTPGQSTNEWIQREVGTGQEKTDDVPGLIEAGKSFVAGDDKISLSAATAKKRLQGDGLTARQRAYIVNQAELLRALGASRGRSGDTSDVEAQIAAVLANWKPESIGLPAGTPISNAREIVDYYQKNPNKKELPALGTGWAELLKGINAEGADSGIVSAGKAALASVPAALAGAGGSAIGTRAATAFAPGAAIPGFIGSLGGAIIGGMAGNEAGVAIADEIPDAVKEQLGMTESQLELNRLANPWSTAAGEQIPGLLGARPGLGKVTRLQDVNPALAGSLLNTGIEAGTQISEGRFDASRLGAAAVGGAFMTQNRKWVDKLSGQTFEYARPTWGGRQLSEHVTYDPVAVRGTIVDDIVAGKTNEEILASHPVVADNTTPAALDAVRFAVEQGDNTLVAEALDTLEIKKNNGLDVDTVRGYGDSFTEGWENAPKINYHASPDADTVPANLRGKQVLGSYDQDTGEVHVFADQLTNESDVQAVVFHEVLGHAGLAFKYQQDLDNLLAGLYEKGNKDFKAAVDEWRAANPKAYDDIYDPKNPPADKVEAERLKRRREAAEVEEVLAETSEQGRIGPRMYDVVANKIRGYARMAGMDHLEYSTREIRSILGMGHENVVSGRDSAKGLGGGVRYIYVGDQAQGINSEDRSFAEDLYQNTEVDPKTIKQYTGWHLGPDGKYRFEIDDSQAQFGAGFDDFASDVPRVGDYVLSDVFDHPDLYDMYPDLAEIKIEREANGRRLGSWDPTKKILKINTNLPEPEILNTLVHEIQHVIQEKEGWLTGSNSALAIRQMSPNQYKKFVDQILDKKLDELVEADLRVELAEKIAQLPEFVAYQEALSAGTVTPGSREQLFERIFGVPYSAEARKKLPPEYARVWAEVSLNATRFPESLERWQRLAADANDSYEKAKKYSKNRNDFAFVFESNKEAFKAYRRSYGELEAEDAATRRTLSMQERNETTPFEKLPERDTPTEEVIYGRGKQSAGLVASDVAPDGMRYARRGGTRNPGYDQRTEQFLDKHLSPKMADELHGLVKNVPGKVRVSDEEVISQALDLGVDLQAAREWGAMPDNSDYLVALKDLMTDKAGKAIESARFIHSGAKGTAADEAQLVKNILEFGEVAVMFDKSRSNLGRMFRALQIKMEQFGEDFEGVRGLLNDIEMGDGSSLDSEGIRDLARRLAEANSPAQIMKEVDRFSPDWVKFADSLFYNGMFSSVQTQWNNIKGNFANLFQSLVRDSGAAAVGSARNAVGAGSPERVLWAEVGKRWSGVGMALANPDTYRAVVREFTAPVGAAHKNKWQSQTIPNQALSMTIEMGTRGLQATDAFFRIVAETSNMHALAYKKAVDEAHRKFGGKYGDEQWQDWIDQRTQDIMNAPPKDLLTAVKKAADILLFQEDLRGISKTLARLRDSSTVGAVPAIIAKILMPIVSVSVNIMKHGAEYSTIPALTRILKNKPKGADLDRELSRLVIGGVVTAAALSYIADDNLTGLGPTDPREKAEWLGSHKPQSIRIGGEWYQYKSLDPVATYLTILADTIQTASRKSKKLANKGEDSWGELSLQTANAFSHAMLSNSFLSGASEIAGDEENIFGRLLISVANPWGRIPIASEVEILSDDYSRDMGAGTQTDKLWNRVRAMDVGLTSKEGREGLPIKRDFLGRPVARVPEVPTDPVSAEIGRLYAATGHTSVSMPSSTPRGKYIPRELYNQSLAIMGPDLNKVLLATMESPSYKKMTDEQKSRVLQRQAQSVRKKYAKLLDLEMLEEDPNYRKQMLSPLKRAFAEDE